MALTIAVKFNDTYMLYKETNKMHIFVSVYSKTCTLHVSNGYTVHRQEFHVSLYSDT